MAEDLLVKQIDGNLLAAAARLGRVEELAAGSREDADMSLNVKKTKAMHTRMQEPISCTTNAEAIKICKFTCPQ